MRLRGDRLLAAEAAASDAAPLALRTRRAPDRLADTQDQPKPQLWPHEKAIVTAAEAQELARLEAEQVAAFQRHELQVRFCAGARSPRGSRATSAARPEAAPQKLPTLAATRAAGRRQQGCRAHERHAGPRRRRDRACPGAPGPLLPCRRRHMLAGAHAETTGKVQALG